ncbi:hypothetical protein [Vibrio aerogenes]|uniref:hypothetical protein n=1 Tax=Vibrio aerogenes TaxID=92172 RepID=UPI0021C44DA1|nr:hypothetical protein [Vibrio aerogenes]
MLEIEQLNKSFKNIDTDISISMSNIRRAQGVTFKQLEKRFTGISGGTLKRHMQQSYPAARPIHLIAAYSWVMMVPMTSFKIQQFYPNLDKNTVKALACIGRLPVTQFNHFLDMVCDILGEVSRNEFFNYKEQLENKYGKLADHREFLPPDVLDIDEFAMDYYHSVAITARRFREVNDISVETASQLIGISKHQYTLLEDTRKTTPLPASIGFRAQVGFQLESHASFTSEMRQFPALHQLRKVQHVRDSLFIKALSLLQGVHKELMTDLLVTLSKIYR